MKELPKVNCIKQYRKETGLGLKESKMAVDSMHLKDQWALAKRWERERYADRVPPKLKKEKSLFGNIRNYIGWRNT